MQFFVPLIDRLRPTVAYDSYWLFAASRQNIFWKRYFGERPPWTADRIIEEYKFTNVYRAADRVSQFLIKEVIYTGPQAFAEVFFRTILFKFFNKIETWELLNQEAGTISLREYSYSKYDSVLTKAKQRGAQIYSSAYIMPSRAPGLMSTYKHQNNLRLLEMMIETNVPEQISVCEHLGEVYQVLLRYPLLGPFLAFQFSIDLCYAAELRCTEDQFVMPGPGAKDGIRKCFSEPAGIAYEDIIKLVTERQEMEFAKRDLAFVCLDARPLQLIDCQNIFCEVDKYSRVRHPELTGLSNRTRIKRKFQPAANQIEFFFPPKWNIRLPPRAQPNQTCFAEPRQLPLFSSG